MSGGEDVKVRRLQCQGLRVSGGECQGLIVSGGGSVRG